MGGWTCECGWVDVCGHVSGWVCVSGCVCGLSRSLVYLSVGVESHVESVDKVMKEGRQLAKVVRNQLRDLAQLLAFQHLHSNDPVDPVATIHR